MELTGVVLLARPHGIRVSAAQTASSKVATESHAIVTALGGVPHPHMAVLVPQAAEALAGEHAERGRTPVLVIDEAHLLTHDQLEGIRMLTLCRGDGYAEATAVVRESPWQARRDPVGRSA